MPGEKVEPPEISRPSRKDNFQVGGFIDPPPVPEQGVSVPPEIVKVAFDLRKKAKDSPAEIPQRWFVWLAEYERAHPYAFRLRQRREEHYAESSEFSATTPEVEKAKGNRVSKILKAVMPAIPSLAEKLNDAYNAGAKAATEAFKQGAYAATEARKVVAGEKKIEQDGNKAAFDALKSALESVGGIAKEAYEMRKDELEDRVELIKMLRDAQASLPEKSEAWTKLGIVVSKAVKVFGPVAKEKLGLDLAGFLEEKKEG